MYHHHHDFPNHIAARTAVMEYIDSLYNRRGPHANNQGLPPHAPWSNTKQDQPRAQRKKKINQAVSQS
jgi:hypothetical protein